MKAFLLLWGLAQAATYQGTLNVQDELYSGIVTLTADASLTCESFTSPNSTVTTLKTDTMAIDTLKTDKLIAKNGVLRLSNDVQVTGKVVYAQANSQSSFLQEADASYTSFLGQSRSLLEEQLNARDFARLSFIQLAGAWSSLGPHVFEAGQLKLDDLGPHTTVQLTAQVFIGAYGTAFLKVDDKVVWMESCEWCPEEWSSNIAVTLAHRSREMLAEFKANVSYSVTEVEVAVRS